MQKDSFLAMASILVTVAPGCRAVERGPSDEEVVALVRESPPAPPTVGPTYLAVVDRVQVGERGHFNSQGRYWPVRVRIRGGAKIKVTNAFQLGLLDDRSRAATEPVEFMQDARFMTDEFGEWRVEYDYSSDPGWRRQMAGPESTKPQTP